MRELERELPTSATAQARVAELPALAIVGAGRIGGSLAAAAKRAGIDATLADREQAPAVLAGAEAALLCVPDTEIAAAAAVAARAVPPLRRVGHTSGATQLDALAPAAAAGTATFSLHPLQTAPDANTDFTGSPCAISGSDAEALGFARALAAALGMRPFEVPEEHRAAYHAAASIASNFLVTLEESAAGLLDAIGIDDARELLAPLVLRTAANWAERGGEALTGPIARGDDATVDRHLAALEARAPELVELYRALASRTREVAR
jgi:predicted short-subunit dehydrogenase-like oxidoreductase (DUF2520 family)